MARKTVRVKELIEWVNEMNRCTLGPDGEMLRNGWNRMLEHILHQFADAYADKRFLTMTEIPIGEELPDHSRIHWYLHKDL